MRYPRNMQGYGGNPPDPEWPGGAKVCVSFVLNYEEGGENCLLHGDAASEGFLSEIPGAAPWPGQRHWNMESVYEYGARAGFWRLRDLFVRKNIPITVYGVASALARGPAQVAAMKEAGWEIASHGLRWIDYRNHTPEAEKADLDEAVRLHTEVVGEPPRGWYTGRTSVQSVDLACEEGIFDWVADTYDDDLPYWREHKNRQQLIIPYTLEANDMRFSAGSFHNAEDYFIYLRDTFDVLYDEGVAGKPKMMTLGLHCRLIGRAGRMKGLLDFINHIQNKGGAWVATRGDIAAHWRARFPAPPIGTARATILTKPEFVKRFGDVYEHSPWIAERAFELELGPAHDTAVCLGNALARAFRSASEDERLGVLNAHPDLAGKTAQAKQLTPESTAEQASAGLDTLSDAEKAHFTELNTAYKKKFGFPFIIAARGLDKASILQAFEQRMGNDRAQEFNTACQQVEKIAQLRLEERMP